MHTLAVFSITGIQNLCDLTCHQVWSRVLQVQPFHDHVRDVHVDLVKDLVHLSYVAHVVGDDQKIFTRGDQDGGLSRKQRLYEGLKGRSLQVFDGDDLGDELVFGLQDPAGVNRQIESAHVLVRHYLGGLARFHQGEPVHRQDGLENIIGLPDRELLRGDHGHLAPDIVVYYEVFPGELAYHADEQPDVHFVEVEHDFFDLLLGRGRRGDDRLQEEEGHRKNKRH